jgi:hypothetical protein
MSFKMKGWSGWSLLKDEKEPIIDRKNISTGYYDKGPVEFFKDKRTEIKPSIGDMDDYRIRQEERFKIFEDYEPSYRPPKKPKKSSYHDRPIST